MDYKTIRVTQRDPDESECPECPTLSGPDSTKSCFVLDTSHVNQDDTVTFRFFNVLIHGKREPGINRKKYTKGFVRYTAHSNELKEPVAKNQARIKFRGGESFDTNLATKTWYQRSFGIMGGRTFTANLPGYKYMHDQLGRWYSVGFYYKDVPLYNGLGWGIDLGSSGFGFLGRSKSMIEFGDESLFRLNREILDIKSLDLQFQIEGRLAGKLIVGGGIGPTIPLRGSAVLSFAQNFVGLTQEQFSQLATLPSEIVNDSDIAIFDDLFNLDQQIASLESNFGIADTGENPFSSGVGFGGMTHGFAEYELSEYVALGASYSYRIYPATYKEKCIKIGHGQLYLRAKLITFK